MTFGRSPIQFGKFSGIAPLSRRDLLWLGRFGGVSRTERYLDLPAQRAVAFARYVFDGMSI